MNMNRWGIDTDILLIAMCRAHAQRGERLSNDPIGIAEELNALNKNVNAARGLAYSQASSLIPKGKEGGGSKNF